MEQNETKRCPECRQQAAVDAKRCAYCGELFADFKECPQCYERVKLKARICRFCRFQFAREEPPPTMADLSRVIEHGVADRSEDSTPQAQEIDFTIAATPVGGALCNQSITALIRPPELRITQSEVNLKSWSMLGMRSIEQKIPVTRVTSVRLLLGVSWGGIVVETFGGGTADFGISGLNKAEAQEMVAIIERYILLRRGGRPEAFEGFAISDAS